MILHIRPSNYIGAMLAFILTLLLFSRFLEFPTLSSPLSISASAAYNKRPVAFTSLHSAFSLWDSEVGCPAFKARHSNWSPNASALQQVQDLPGCQPNRTGSPHVSVLVKAWTWIPDNLDNIYYCRCGLTCLWTKSSVLADKPDALLFETATPPRMDSIIYWSSSRCLPERNKLAKKFLSLVPHHSFGKCLNNVGGLDMALSFYPECSNDDDGSTPQWWDHLHCAMSHYKFVLAIENTMTDSYVTEKLFYALDAGAVPIYFGAPNVWDFVPPNSIIDGSKFSSLQDLASYVKAVADDPVAYAEYHAWRRCGVLGNYGKTRATSLDTLPCRLCELVSKRGGRSASAY